MRPFLTILIAFTAASAHAQYGIGITPSNQCPYGYQAAPGAINGRDEVSNLTGKYDHARNQLDAIEQELEGYDDKLERCREDMGRVLPGTAIRSIEDHRTFKRGYYDYYDCPKNPGQTASASGAGVTATLPKRGATANPSGSANNSTPVYPPEEFCYGGGVGKKPVNTWAEFVDDKGIVSDEVCNYKIPNYNGTPAREDSRQCREGLRNYYRYMSQREKLQKRRAQLDADCQALEKKLNRIEEEIAEGSYCPYCNNQRRGYSQGSLTDNILPIAITLGMAGLAMYQQQNRPQFGGQPQYGPRMNAPFNGPRAYPGNPYPAITPGYMGVQNGVYGALPGGVGAGAFCPQPNYANNQNLFGNPYTNQLTDPSAQNSLFNPGYGPGFMPVLGNGVNNYNPYDPYNPFGGQNGNPFQEFAQNQNPYYNTMNGNQNGGFGPPSTLPYLGQNPYFQNQYQFNPVYGNQNGGNPYSNLYGNQFGLNGGGYPPGYSPYQGNSYGNPYGSPYMQGLPYNGQYGNAGYANYQNGGAMANYYWQMQQMRGSLGGIQNSPYYGGSSPAFLPYPGPVYNGGYGVGGGYNGGYGYGGGGYHLGGGFNYSSPIYNIPGTNLNPLPIPRPRPVPQPLPIPPPGGATPGGIIRSR